MDFETAYKQADTILKRWGAKGVEEAGEAESDWIFKGYATKGIASEAIILIDRSNGEIRIFNAGRRRDRDVTRTAKKIKIST